MNRPGPPHGDPLRGDPPQRPWAVPPPNHVPHGHHGPHRPPSGPWTPGGASTTPPGLPPELRHYSRDRYAPPGPAPRSDPRFHDRTPGWWADFGRALLCALIGVAITTGLLALAQTGLLHTRNRDVIEGGAVFAALLATMQGLSWGLAMFKPRRDDNGFRTRGLAPLLVAGIAVGAIVQQTAMLFWPTVMGSNAAPGSLAATMDGDLTAVATVSALLVATMSWFTTIWLAMTCWGARAALGALVPFLGAIALFGWTAVTTFDDTPSSASLLGWTAAAATGLAAVAITAMVLTRTRRTTRPV